MDTVAPGPYLDRAVGGERTIRRSALDVERAVGDLERAAVLVARAVCEVDVEVGPERHGAGIALHHIGRAGTRVPLPLSDASPSSSTTGFDVIW